VGDVILDLYHGEVSVLAEQGGGPVGIRDEAAGDADPGNIEDVGTDVVDGGRAADARGLTQDAVGRFQPGCDIADRAVVIGVSEFVLEDVDLGRQCGNGALIRQQEPGKVGVRRRELGLR
jgi:hypothetical protein